VSAALRAWSGITGVEVRVLFGAPRKASPGGAFRVLGVECGGGGPLSLTTPSKRGDWTGWYERNIPRADDLLDAHLASMRRGRGDRSNKLASAKDLRRRRPPNRKLVESIKRSVELDIALNELRERRGITKSRLLSI
jgi:hypothetical protein